MDEPTLSDAVVRFIWHDDASIPGRHPDNVTDPALRAAVELIVDDLDAIRPDETAAELFPWADAKARELALTYGLDEDAVRALRALLSWQWR